MARTVTYVNRYDIYGIDIHTPIDKLKLDDFLINVDTLGITDSVIFMDSNGETKILK